MNPKSPSSTHNTVTLQKECTDGLVSCQQNSCTTFTRLIPKSTPTTTRRRKRHCCHSILTVYLTVVGATVKEDAHSVVASVVHFVLKDFDVIAPLGGDDT